jgi:hypothetical protein
MRIPARGEARTAIGGILRLARFDARAIGNFDPGIDACIRSFWAAAGSLPAFYLALLLEGTDGIGDDGDPALAIFVQTIGFVIGCLTFPLASERVLHWLDHDNRWPLLVTSYNWLSFVQNWAMLALVALFHGGFLAGFANPVFAIFFLFCLIVEGFIFSVVISGHVSLAIALVLIDLVLGQSVDAIARSIA